MRNLCPGCLLLEKEKWARDLSLRQSHQFCTLVLWHAYPRITISWFWHYCSWLENIFVWTFPFSQKWKKEYFIRIQNVSIFTCGEKPVFETKQMFLASVVSPRFLSFFIWSIPRGDLKNISWKKSCKNVFMVWREEEGKVLFVSLFWF